MAADKKEEETDGPKWRPSFCDDCKQPIVFRKPIPGGKLTQEQIAEFRDTFQMFDKDGDGTINTNELGAVLRSLGQSPDEEDLQDMIDDADEDESGTINFQEFVGLMLKSQTSGLTREDIKQAYRVFDKDGNGYVSAGELRYVMAKLGVNFSDEELEEMVLEADLNGDGQVSFDEFYNMMASS